MEREHQTVLQLSLKLLQDQLTGEDVQSLLDHLYCEDIFTRADTESVLGLDTCLKRVSCLVSLLERRGMFAYSSLIEGLNCLPGKQELVKRFRDTEEKLEGAKALLLEYIPKAYMYDQTYCMELGQFQDELRVSLDPAWRRFITKSVAEVAAQIVYPEYDVMETSQAGEKIVRLRNIAAQKFNHSDSEALLSREELVTITVLSTATEMFKSTLSSEDINNIVTHLQVYDCMMADRWKEFFLKPTVQEKIVFLIELLNEHKGALYSEFIDIIRSMPSLKHLLIYCKSSEVAVIQALDQTKSYFEEAFKKDATLKAENNLEKLRNKARENCDRKLRRFITKTVTANAIREVQQECGSKCECFNDVFPPSTGVTENPPAPHATPYKYDYITSTSPMTARKRQRSFSDTDVKYGEPGTSTELEQASVAMLEHIELEQLPTPPPVPVYNVTVTFPAEETRRPGPPLPVRSAGHSPQPVSHTARDYAPRPVKPRQQPPAPPPRPTKIGQNARISVTTIVQKAALHHLELPRENSRDDKLLFSKPKPFPKPRQKPRSS